MPRYVVERSFPEGLSLPTNVAGAAKCVDIVNTNAEEGVTWLHSYVSADHARTYCVYDAPNPEAIRQVARRNGLPVDQITEISVLNPYFYLSMAGASRAAANRTVYRAPWRPFRYFL
ncbi:DUF4242 domain-containing protein [Dyella sp. EPa41]|uniref:DUF4242 domain-containing protein n=1 Tax=Dyella sp. EPa41 TaxID=1561194 RepID=UPI001914F070|nr:DUF4242 domain-containing protein [Dyella sp. EPa41]